MPRSNTDPQLFRPLILFGLTLVIGGVVGGFLSPEDRSSFHLLIVSLGFCAFIAMQIADAKGNSVRAWAVAGFLLGPMGIALAIINPTNQQALDERAIEKGIAKRCPACCELAKTAATRCPYCREALSVQDQ